MRKMFRSMSIVMLLILLVCNHNSVFADTGATGYTWVQWRGEKFMIPNNMSVNVTNYSALILQDSMFLPDVILTMKVFDVDPEEAKKVDLEQLNATITLETAPVSGVVEKIDARGTTCYLSTSSYTGKYSKPYIIKCADFVSINDTNATVFVITLSYPQDKDDSTYVNDFYKLLSTEPDSFLYSNHEFPDVEDILSVIKDNIEANSASSSSSSDDSYDFDTDDMLNMLNSLGNIFGALSS